MEGSLEEADSWQCPDTPLWFDTRGYAAGDVISGLLFDKLEEIRSQIPRRRNGNAITDLCLHRNSFWYKTSCPPPALLSPNRHGPNYTRDLSSLRPERPSRGLPLVCILCLRDQGFQSIVNKISAMPSSPTRQRTHEDMILILATAAGRQAVEDFLSQRDEPQVCERWPSL